MYHLLAKVYVETEFRVDPRKTQINLSGHTGFERVGDNVGFQLGYAAGLDSLMPSDFEALLQKAIGHGDKVMIFADDASYTRLYSIMIKALFPGISKETFTHFFLCAKATYDTSRVNLHDQRTNQTRSVTINRTVVDTLYALDDPFVAPMQALLEAYPDDVSLEWRLIKLKAFKQTGTIPDALRNLQRRTALNNSHDAMDDWGRAVLEPERWHLSGASFDSLLDSPSVFEGCLKFQALMDPMLRSPEVLDYQMPNEWLIELVEEIVAVMEFCGDYPAADRNKTLIWCLAHDDMLDNPITCLQRAKVIFDNGVAGFRLGHLDSVKYDENLIRLILRTPEDELQALMEHSTW